MKKFVEIRRKTLMFKIGEVPKNEKVSLRRKKMKKKDNC